MWERGGWGGVVNIISYTVAEVNCVVDMERAFEKKILKIESEISSINLTNHN